MGELCVRFSVFGVRVPLKSTCARKPPYKHFKLDFVNLHHDILLFLRNTQCSGFGFRFSGLGVRFSVFGFGYSGFGFRFSVFGFRFSVFGFHLWVD